MRMRYLPTSYCREKKMQTKYDTCTPSLLFNCFRPPKGKRFNEQRKKERNRERKKGVADNEYLHRREKTD